MYSHQAMLLQPVHSHNDVIATECQYFQCCCELHPLHLPATLWKLPYTSHCSSVYNSDFQHLLWLLLSSQLVCQSFSHETMGAPRIDQNGGIKPLNTALEPYCLWCFWSIHCCYWNCNNFFLVLTPIFQRCCIWFRLLDQVPQLLNNVKLNSGSASMISTPFFTTGVTQTLGSPVCPESWYLVIRSTRLNVVHSSPVIYSIFGEIGRPFRRRR